MQQEIINEIYQEWSRLKAKNPLISLRALSKRMDIPHSALSEILNGKRKVSKKMAIRVLNKLNLDENIHKDLMEKIDSSKKYELIDLQEFKVISHWEHLAILNLFKLKNFSFCSDWMSKRLGISKAKVESAVKRLFSAGLLKRLDDGAVRRSQAGHFKTPTDIKNQALNNFTKESFEEGIKSLEKDDVSVRDFSTVTLTVNEKDIPKAKKLIEEFRYKFDQEIESVPGEEIYKLIVGFYPVSKKEVL